MPQYSADRTYAVFENEANRQVVSELKALGAMVHCFPEKEHYEMLTGESAGIINNLNAFDWIIFSDVYTVDHFLGLMNRAKRDLFELDSHLICAIGESVADRLRFSQLHADVVTATVIPSNISVALSDYIASEDLSGLKFLMLKKEGPVSEVTKILCERLALVSETILYRSAGPDESVVARLKALLMGGAIDEFIITSAEDLVDLSNIFQLDNLHDIFADTLLVPTNDSATQAIIEHRLGVK